MAANPPSDSMSGEPSSEQAAGQAHRLSHLSTNTRDATYRPAYSRLVRRLRIILPTVVVLTVAIVILWPKIRAQFSPPTQTSTEERQAKMVNGRYVGSDSHGRPYTVT